METLWAPWRMDYIQKEPLPGCFFCEKFSEDSDAENYILFREKHGFILLNIYPYNNAHIMAAHVKHAADITQLDLQELADLMGLVQKGVSVLNRAYKPQGFNIGINQGSIAGAGVVDHLHIHIVPRWAGDTNFMPVLSNTKVMPQYLIKTYNFLLPFF